MVTLTLTDNPALRGKITCVVFVVHGVYYPGSVWGGGPKTNIHVMCASMLKYIYFGEGYDQSTDTDEKIPELFSLSLSLSFMATQLCISAHTSNTLLTVTGRHGSSQVHAVKIHCEKKKKLVQMLNICTDGETTEMRAQQRGSPLSDGPTRKMKSWPGANRGCRKCSCQTLATPGPVWRNACKHSVLIRTRNIW